MRTRALALTAILAALSHTACVAPTGTDEDEAVSQDALSAPEGDGDEPVSAENLAQGRANTDGFEDIPALTPEQREAILARYAAIPHPGVREVLFEKAMLYYDTNLARIPNKRWVTVLDFAKHSGKQRFHILDMQGGAMRSHVVAHGKNSDVNHDGWADSFSNVNGSNQSSVGYYLTAETYIGANGRSLRLDGLSSTNSNARERLVVIHGADYVAEGNAKQGRSLGCPALPHPVVQGVIDDLMQGSLLYAMN